jgi:hypothetical protein
MITPHHFDHLQIVPDLETGTGSGTFGYGLINQLVLMTSAKVNDVPPQRGRLGELFMVLTSYSVF